MGRGAKSRVGKASQTRTGIWSRVKRVIGVEKNMENGKEISTGKVN